PCWQASADRNIRGAAFAAMAFPTARSAFPFAPPAGPHIRARTSLKRHSALGDVADSTHARRLGGDAEHWLTPLDTVTRLGGNRRERSSHGLRLLVVALGQSHGAIPLALP